MKLFLYPLLGVALGLILAAAIIYSLQPPKSDCTLSRGRLICPEAIKAPKLPRTALCNPETAAKDHRCTR